MLIGPTRRRAMAAFGRAGTPLGMCAVAFVIACDSPGDIRADAWLLSELQVRAGIETSATERVLLDSVSSTAIDGLSYLILTVVDDSIADGWRWIAIGANWGGQLQFLSGPEALTELLGAAIVSETEPEDFCREAVTYANLSFPLSVLPAVLPRGTSLSEFAASVGAVIPDPLEASVHPPLTVSAVVGESTTTLWAAEANRLARYECRISSAGIRLRLVESVSGVGFVTP
jgi:hypothetical protein